MEHVICQSYMRVVYICVVLDLYISEAFRNSFSLSTLSAVTLAMCSKNTFSALWIGQPFLRRNSSCCFLSNSRVLAAMAFCFSATFRAFSLLNNILSRLVSLDTTDHRRSPPPSYPPNPPTHLSNMSLALVLSSLLQVASDSSSWMREVVPSLAPTHNNRPVSWI